MPQEIALYETLSARNNLRFFAQLYGLRGQELEDRCQALLEDVELADRADDVAVSAFSGGMQRRVNIAAALVHDPQIIFMDEPTVGLDPVSRTAIWKVIETLKSRGKTIVLTTHYMDEAEALCDRVAIVDHGKVVALGTPAELILQTGVKTTYTLTVEGTGSACVPPLKALSGVIEASSTGGRITVFAESEPGLLVRIIETLLATSTRISGVEVAGPNLGAVFLHFTGANCGTNHAIQPQPERSNLPARVAGLEGLRGAVPAPRDVRVHRRAAGGHDADHRSGLQGLRAQRHQHIAGRGGRPRRSTGQATAASHRRDAQGL